MVDNGGIWDEQSFKDFEAARDAANFRLQQAAPMMLEALEAAFDLLKEYQSIYQHPDNIDPIIDEIEAAIKAAKGEV